MQELTKCTSKAQFLMNLLGNRIQQEYTEELQVLNYLDNHDGVITHLEPLGGMSLLDILECEVKWESAALNMPAILENSAVATGLEKVSFHPNPKEEQC